MNKKENKITGNFGEDLAAQYLQERGYQIIDRNLHLPIGEIDILAKHSGTIVIVEVKTVRGGGFGMAQELVRFKKQNKLKNLARSIEQIYPNKPIRIDVIAVDLSSNSPKIEHLQNVIN